MEETKRKWCRAMTKRKWCMFALGKIKMVDDVASALRWGHVEVAISKK